MTRHVQMNGPGKIEVTVPKCYLVVILLNVVDVRLPGPVGNDISAFRSELPGLSYLKSNSSEAANPAAEGTGGPLFTLPVPPPERETQAPDRFGWPLTRYLGRATVVGNINVNERVGINKL